MTPSYTFIGKVKQSFLRYFADRVLFRKANKVMHTILGEYGIEHFNLSAFDLLVKKQRSCCKVARRVLNITAAILEKMFALLVLCFLTSPRNKIQPGLTPN